MSAKVPFFLAAFIVGMMLAVQAPLNAEVARQAGNAMVAAIVSFLVSLAVILPLALGTWNVSLAWATEVPWWAWLGGFAGAAFVAGSILIVPMIGVAAFFAFVVFGQLAGSALIDQTGAFDMAVRPITVERAVAILLVLSGVVLFIRAAP